MNWDDLQNFTWEELHFFTWNELSLCILDLIKSIQDDNREIPVCTYEKLRTIANKLDIPAEQTLPSPVMSAKKYILMSVIIPTILKLVPTGDAILDFINKMKSPQNTSVSDEASDESMYCISDYVKKFIEGLMQ